MMKMFRWNYHKSQKIIEGQTMDMKLIQLFSFIDFLSEILRIFLRKVLYLGL